MSSSYFTVFVEQCCQVSKLFYGQYGHQKSLANFGRKENFGQLDKNVNSTYTRKDNLK